MSFEPGTIVILYLGQPREQVFGVVMSLNAAGVTLRCMTLESVDDWMREIASKPDDAEATFGLSTTFYPMHRVEKVVLDESAHGALSIQDRFKRRTGMTVAEYLAG